VPIAVRRMVFFMVFELFVVDFAEFKFYWALML
jgi:hypothetical protein